MAFLNKPTTKLRMYISDFNGKRATLNFWLDGLILDVTDAAVTAMVSAVNGIIDGYVSSVELLAGAAQAPGAAGTGPFQSVRDKMKLECQTASGSRVTLTCPSFDESYLSSDGVTFNLSDADVAAVATYVTTHLKSATGEAIARVSRIYRERSDGLVPANL